MYVLTSSSVSVQERVKIFPVLGRSSSVVGGVMGRPSLGMRPSFGTLMLPLGFFLCLNKEASWTGRGFKRGPFFGRGRGVGPGHLSHHGS